MRNLIGKLVMAVVLGAATPGWAVIDFTDLGGGNFSATSPGPQLIPDFSSSGVAYALNFNSAGFGQLTDITFTFTTIGGWNGDLYAYLSHGSDLAILLNQVGASPGNPDGYGTSGFNSITLAMSATTDIHGVALPTSGNGPYAADGRLDYSSSTRNNTLSVFNGVDPNGIWTLYFADESPTFQATLSSWSLHTTAIPAVPEPGTAALAVLGLCVAGFGIGRRFYRRAQA
jgi:hypothetical protein